jgi:hypothetical protein
MAPVRRLTHKKLEKTGIHSEAECTYSVVDGQYLQIDTYSSKMRRNPDTLSQTIRFTPEAIEQLKAVLQKHF